MKACRILLISMMALAPAAPAQQAPPSGSLASIHGVVINAATNQPVSGAIVELTGIENGKVLSHSAVTGEEGTFVLQNLKPIRDYQLTVTENDNFLPGAFGQHNANDPWVSIALTAGQDMSGVRVTLTPLSSITGKVVDGTGKPHRGAYVYVLRATYAGGRRVLMQAGSTQTNEQGEYFIGRLGTGQYYVRADPTNSEDYRQLFESPARWDSLRTQKPGEPEGYPPTYHPNTRDLTAARPIDLLNGGRVRDVNVVVAKVHTHRVTGTVSPEANVPSAASASVLLVPQSAGPESSFTRKVTANQDGQFDFRGVLPGAYYLIAVINMNNTQMTARKPLTVGDADLQKQSISVARGFDIPGTIRFADWQRGMPPDYSQLAVNLVPDTRAPMDRTFAGYRVIAPTLTFLPAPDGTFLLTNIVPNDYRIVISLNPKLAANSKVPLDLKAAYMKSARLANIDTLDGGMHIDGKTDGPLQIVIATDSGSVFGRVLDDDHQPVVPARMVIVPETSLRKRFDLFSPVRVTSTGRFTLDGIPPGDYKLFAWAHVEDGAWYDPEFMRVYEDRGTPVHIEESGSYPIEIPLLH